MRRKYRDGGFTEADSRASAPVGSSVAMLLIIESSWLDHFCMECTYCWHLVLIIYCKQHYPAYRLSDSALLYVRICLAQNHMYMHHFEYLFIETRVQSKIQSSLRHLSHTCTVQKLRNGTKQFFKNFCIE